MYAIFPVRDGVVIDGPVDGAGYDAESQREARAAILAAVPEATGTARCWQGDLPAVGVGSIAGVDLDAEERRV